MLVSDLGQAIGAGGLADEAAHRLSELFWPGALSLVLPTADGETQAFRAPDHPVALDLIRAAGAIFTSSANRSGEPETLGADDVLIAFATQQDELAAVVDGGHVSGGIASTVLDLSVSPARILRVGPVTREQIAEIVEVA
jgi:L-threonylcarbamoyladenylate synthase